MIPNRPTPPVIRRRDLNTVTVADIPSRPVGWLWPNRIARGKLCIIGGDPGVGKSYLSLDIAARVTTGREWPDGAQPVQPQNVILLSAEDSIGDIIRPRLDKLGADTSKVQIVGPVFKNELKITPISIIQHLRDIERAITDNSAALLVIDPLLAFADESVNINMPSHVRRLLFMLADLAHTTGCAIIGIMHLNKRAMESNALYRITASLDFVAAARGVIIVAPDPSDTRSRVMAHAKSNLAAVPPSLTFRLTDDGALHWTGPSEINASELFNVRASNDAHALTEAMNFLYDALSCGPRPAKEIISEANELTISAKTLKRARKALGIKAIRINSGITRGQGRWLLVLDDVQEGQSSGVHVDPLEPLEQPSQPQLSSDS